MMNKLDRAAKHAHALAGTSQRGGLPARRKQKRTRARKNLLGAAWSIQLLEKRVLMSGTNWMAGVPDNIPLTQMSIPGTHDTMTGTTPFTLSNLGQYIDPTFDGPVDKAIHDAIPSVLNDAYNAVWEASQYIPFLGLPGDGNLGDDLSSVANSIVNEIINSGAYLFGGLPITQAIAQTQDLTLGAQLDEGVRALDIRLAENNNVLSCTHGSLPIGNLQFVSDVLEPATRFLAHNPSETLVMQVQDDFDGSGNTQNFDQVFRQETQPYSSYLYTPTESEPIPATLGEARGKIVIIQSQWNGSDASYPTPAVFNLVPAGTLAPGAPAASSQDDFDTSDVDRKWAEAKATFDYAAANLIPASGSSSGSTNIGLGGGSGTLGGPVTGTFTANYLSTNHPGGLVSETQQYAFPIQMATGSGTYLHVNTFDSLESALEDLAGLIVVPASLDGPGMNARADALINSEPLSTPTGVVFTDFADLQPNLIQDIYSHNPMATSLASTGTLTIDASQTGSTGVHTITIGQTASGGLTAGLDGQVETFDPGSVSSIIIKSAPGSDTVDLQTIPAGVTYVNVQGLGNPTTLQSPDGTTNTWHLTGAGSGTIDVGSVLSLVTFSGVTNDLGGSGVDNFKFLGGSVPGTLDGGAGANYLFYNARAAGPTSVNLQSNTSTGIGGTFAHVTAITGNPSLNSTFTGSNGGAWVIDGPGTGYVNGIRFYSFANLTGGASTDFFSFRTGGSIIGNIDGGTGTNTIDYQSQVGPVAVNFQSNTSTGIGGTFANVSRFIGSAGSDTLTGPNAAATWNITDVNTGTVSFGPTTDTFISFENLIGGSGNDGFAFSATGTLSGNLDGGGGTNTLNYSAATGPVSVNLQSVSVGGSTANISSIVGSNSPGSTLIASNGNNSWLITGPGTGSVNGIAFSGFANLTGGSSTDTFAIKPGACITGNLDGAGGTNTLDYSALPGPVSVNLQTNVSTGVTGTFANLTRFIGSAGVDALTGPNATAQWIITGINAGTVNSNAFSSFEKLTGGTGNDSFAFYTGGSVGGNLNGAGGVNTLDYSNLTTTVSVNLQTGVASAIAGTFAGFSNFIGSSSLVNALTASNVANAWSITAAGGGAVNAVTFLSFANLTGGSSTDTFAIKPGGSVPGKLDGAGGANTLDYSALAGPVSVNLQTSTASLIGTTFANITSFIGSTGTDTLTGPNSASQWNITGVNAGTVNTVAFSSFENLLGGSGADSFAVYNGGSITGSINGGGGANIADYSHNTGNVIIDLALNTSAGVVGAISNITGAIGGQGNSLFVGNSLANSFTGGSGRSIIIGEGGVDTLTGGGGDSILIGGSTTWDRNMTALNAIFTLWNSTSLCYAQRVLQLSCGQFAYNLNYKTVFSDTSIDTLNDGAGLTWSFVTLCQDNWNPKHLGDLVTLLFA